jgi:hypothetical protein
MIDLHGICVGGMGFPYRYENRLLRGLFYRPLGKLRLTIKVSPEIREVEIENLANRYMSIGRCGGISSTTCWKIPSLNFWIPLYPHCDERGLTMMTLYQ